MSGRAKVKGRVMRRQGGGGVKGSCSNSGGWFWSCMCVFVLFSNISLQFTSHCFHVLLC